MFVILLFTILSMDGGYAFAGKIYITKEKGLEKQEERLVENFSRQLLNNLRGKESAFLPAKAAGGLKGHDDIVVALGEGALKEVLRGDGNSPVIGVFISRSSYADVLSGVSSRRKVTAVYSDPSPKRQIALIKALLGEGASVGVIKSSSTEEEVKQAVITAKELGVRMQVADIQRFRNPKLAVDELKGTRTLLLQKDKELFDSIPLDTLLVLAYDLNNLGIIGYSSGVVKNGALATTYTSLDDTVKSVADIIREFDSTGKIPVPDYSEYYSVVVNKYVVRSLDIYERDEDAVKKEVASLLKEEK